MKNIAKKLVEVMKECKYVAKNGINMFHKYKYAASGDVLEKVNTALTKHGIATVVVPEIISNEEVVNLKQNKEHLVTIKVEITLIDTDSGETTKFIGYGSGQDATDKAIMKAQTAALKYGFMLSLAIATGDDPEKDAETDKSMTPSPTKSEEKSKTIVNPTPTPDQTSTINQPRVNEILVKNKKISKTGYKCYDCGAKVTDKVAEFSASRYGKVICMECQKMYQESS